MSFVALDDGDRLHDVLHRPEEAGARAQAAPARVPSCGRIIDGRVCDRALELARFQQLLLARARGFDERDVAELAAGSRLACRTGGDARAGSRARRVFGTVPDQVHEQRWPRVGRAERQPRIARRWFSNWLVSDALDRPVAGVVDARRDLVRQQLPADLEELEREHADVARARRAAASHTTRRRPAARSRRGAPRVAQDPVAVHVLDERPEACLAVGRRGRRSATARGRTRRVSSRIKAGSGPGRSSTSALALAVVAEPPRLQDRRAGLRPRRRSGRSGSPSRRKSCFSTSRSCATSSACADGIARAPPRRLDRDVLELVRDDAGALRRAGRAAPDRRTRRRRSLPTSRDRGIRRPDRGSGSRGRAGSRRARASARAGRRR